jgi:hypothetical protein
MLSFGHPVLQRKSQVNLLIIGQKLSRPEASNRPGKIKNPGQKRDHIFYR